MLGAKRSLENSEEGSTPSVKKAKVEAQENIDSGKKAFEEGMDFLEEGEEEEALTAFTKAVDVWPDNVKALAQLGSLLKHRQEFDSARPLLKRAVARARELWVSWEMSPSKREQVVAGVSAAYTLALLLAQEGQEAESDHYLGALGFRLKLSSQILHYAKPQPNPPPEESTVGFQVLDNTLPKVLLEALQDGFVKGTRFWEDHGYPTDHFFSYHYTLADPPKNLVEQTILEIRPLVRRVYPEMKSVIGAEWWVHKRGTGGGHQLHFDLDERHLNSGNGVRSALCTSILYLTGGSCFGPTLVTDQHLKAGLAKNGWLVHPKANRMVIFDGSQLHGVIPGRPLDKVSTEKLNNLPRVTIMIAWWIEDVRYKGEVRYGEFAGNFTVPDFSRKDVHYTWNLDIPVLDAKLPSIAPSPIAVPQVSPVWEKVLEREGQKVFSLPRLPEVAFYGRFFLKSPSQIDNEVLGEDSDSDGDQCEESEYTSASGE